ncbi:unnamed protein product [Effrenium voratum]|nr:unnamed protein product [Effrenium voratum]
MDSEDPQPLKVWEIASSDLEQFESIFNADDLNAFRRRVLQDVRMQLVPYLQQLLLSGVFSRYSTQFIARIVKDMDLRLFEPGQVIFKEKSLGRSLGVLVSGVVDIIVNGRKVMSKSSSGQEIGEAALFETNYRRHATTRCGSCESLMFLVSRDAFYMCLEKFPEEKIKLAEQVRHRIAMTVLKEPFNMCDPAFLHLVCTECEVVNLSWPKAACSPDSADEVMHLCYAGDLIVEVEGQDSRFAKKWEIFGLEAALGLRSGPPEYKLLAGRAGCTLVRVTWKAFEGALRFFPTQLWHLLRLASGSVPKDHPFVGQDGPHLGDGAAPAVPDILHHGRRLRLLPGLSPPLPSLRLRRRVPHRCGGRGVRRLGPALVRGGPVVAARHRHLRGRRAPVLRRDVFLLRRLSQSQSYCHHHHGDLAPAPGCRASAGDRGLDGQRGGAAAEHPEQVAVQPPQHEDLAQVQLRGLRAAL